PATRPDRVAKLPSTGADLGVVDLEDAVAPAAKADARRLAADACAALVASGTGMGVVVRVNPPRTEHFAADVAEALVEGITAVMIPKVETAADLDIVSTALDRRGLGDVALVAGFETAAGVLHCEAVLSGGRVGAVYFGAEDYVADLGGERTAEGTEVLHARSHVALAARVHGARALDQIVPGYGDDEQFRRDAAVGRSLGYAGKLCIHPRQ